MNLDKFYNEEFSNSISKLILKSKKDPKKKALFVDRDGVLIEDVHRINSPNKVTICPNLINFLGEAKFKGYEIIIITNQSSVSRSIISYSDYKAITAKFLSYLTEDLYPELILSSFHLPNNANNLEHYNWRKPGSGMIDYALNIKGYNKYLSALIGDKLSDLMAGYNGGIRNLIYIKSKLHENESLQIKDWSKKNSIQFSELRELNCKFI